MGNPGQNWWRQPKKTGKHNRAMVFCDGAGIVIVLWVGVATAHKRHMPSFFFFWEEGAKHMMVAEGPV